jgi:integrase
MPSRGAPSTSQVDRRPRPFGGARQLPSGRWQAYYPGPDGRRYTAGGTFATEREARDWLDDVRSEIRRGTWRRPELGQQRLDEYAVAWLTARDDLKPRTQDLYADLLDLHVFPILGGVSLERLTPQLVRQWHRELGQRTGATRRAQAYRLLRTITNQAVRDGAIVTSPCVLRGAGTVRHAERVPATLDELAVIAAAVPDRYRMLVLGGAWSGLRFGELTALRRCDVDADAPSFTVTRAMHRSRGRWLVTGPKSAAGDRTVFLPPHLRDDLVDHLARHVGASPDALVFATRTGTPLARSNWSVTFGRAREQAGRPDLRFHDLRHTGATLAAQTGATTRELMNRLGHGSARAAMIYQHAAAERDRAIAAALAEAATAGGGVIPLRSRRSPATKRGTGTSPD